MRSPLRPALTRRFLVLAAGWCSLLPAPGQVMTGPNKITRTVNGVTFDSAYDNGSLQNIVSGGAGVFNGTLYSETGEKGAAEYWFRFRMHGLAGKTITLNLSHVENPRPALRIGQGAWRRLTSSEAPTNASMVLSFGALEPNAEVAFFEPLGYAEINEAVAALAGRSDFAVESVIGASFENRPLQMVTVEDPYFPRAGKRRVWVHSRVHAGEITASHTMLGFLEQVLANTETARQLREHCLFTIVPVVNVDGVAQGLTRWDAQGLDQESDWCSIRAPEVAALKSQVDTFMASPNPVSVALNLHSTKGNYADSFFFKHLAPSVSPAFVTLQQDYIDAVNSASPLFNNASPQTSQLNPCTFIESYFWNNWGESVMALTHEGHYYRRQTDSAWITAADYRAIGAALARGLINYYQLPPCSEPALTYGAWLARYFTAAELLDPAIAGEAADPDADGAGNLLEYAAGRQPRFADAGTGALVSEPDPGRPGQQRLTAGLASCPVDLEVHFEHSTDLTHWERTPDPLSAPFSGGPALTSVYGRRAGDGQAIETLHLSIPPAVAPARHYYRLKVQRLP